VGINNMHKQEAKLSLG